MNAKRGTIWYTPEDRGGHMLCAVLTAAMWWAGWVWVLVGSLLGWAIGYAATRERKEAR